MIEKLTRRLATSDDNKGSAADFSDISAGHASGCMISGAC